MEVLNRRTNGFTAVWFANDVLHRPLMTSVLAVTVLLYPVMLEFCTTATAYVVNEQMVPLMAVTPTANVPAGEYCVKSTMFTVTSCAPALPANIGRSASTAATTAITAFARQPRRPAMVYRCVVVVGRSSLQRLVGEGCGPVG